MANRADLAKMCQKTQMCKFFLANTCERNNHCTYAHSIKEMQALPNLRCTQFCPTALLGKVCTDADCKFAHRGEDLKRFPGSNSHKAEVRSIPEAANLQLVQASLAAMAAQQALIAARAFVLNKCMSGFQGASVLKEELVALRQAQTANSQALVSLEKWLRVSSNKDSAERHVSDCEDCSRGIKTGMGSCESLASSDEVTEDSESHMDRSKTCWPESDCETESFSRQASRDDLSTDSEPDTAGTVADVGIAFGRHISDFGPVFSRQVSYKREIERSNGHNDTHAACDSAGLCIKNTFYTLMEEEPTGSSSRRSVSAPGRCVSGSAARQTTSVSVDNAAEAPQQASKRHIQAMCTKPTVQQEQSPQELTPLPAEPLHAGPVLLGRVVAGTTKKALQLRKGCASFVQAP
eukprot:TRINITY_DN9354_c0_g1_i2.p1 TRINITY_DN9354_c0_g1~~TRINITY_DN9354_c0_g1_i2.p1  ORF type:complete len:407 (+),score=68.86 TRINITY_DN9354_c0_g1_i2:94-1314(+)